MEIFKDRDDCVHYIEKVLRLVSNTNTQNEFLLKRTNFKI